MKKIYRILFLFIVIVSVAGFSSCDKYLEESPDNRQELKTLDDLSELLVSAYSEASYNFIEWRTDNSVAILQNYQRQWLTENFNYEPITSYEGQDSPSYLWNLNYAAISHSNQALEGLDMIEGGDQVKRNAIRGEALITRAYNHFILASIFCQAYDNATASKELGIPYITAPEKALQVNYKRGTLKETYDLIEKDLVEAIPLISDEFYKGTGKYHFNKNAAYAFASRFYLWKGDYANCIKYSNMLLGDGIVNIAFCRDYAEVFKGSSTEAMANNFINPDSQTNLLLVRKETSVVARYFYGYQPTAKVFDNVYLKTIQQDGDKRDRRMGYSTGAVNPPKYVELFRYTTATTGYPYFVMNELRSEETILNRMEAYVNTGKINEALADYNVYAPTRYLGTGGKLTLEEIVKYYKGTDKEAMMKFIISERRKEFFREGMRWWDIKRYKLSITHKDIAGNVTTLKESDARKAIQIPAKAVANGIEANPN